MLHAFLFESNTFIINTRLKLAKNQAKAKQYSEAERHLKIIHFLHPHYQPRIIGPILKNKQKTVLSVFTRLYD